MDEAFDIDVAIRDLPLDLANAIQPGLGLAGRVNGTARVTGPRATPDVRFTVAAADVASAMTRNAGLPPVVAERHRHDRRRPAEPRRDRRVRRGPRRPRPRLGAARRRHPRPRPSTSSPSRSRSSTGSPATRACAAPRPARAASPAPLADPHVSFNVRGEGLTARMLAENGIPPLGLTATGELPRAAP